MWSWNHRESNSIRTAWGYHGSFSPTHQLTLHVPLILFLFCFQSSHFLSPGTLSPSASEGLHTSIYLELRKMAQLLGSSKDQLGALDRQRISRKQRTPNSGSVEQELLQYTLQDCLLTHSGKECEAAGPCNRTVECCTHLPSRKSMRGRSTLSAS